TSRHAGDPQLTCRRWMRERRADRRVDGRDAHERGLHAVKRPPHLVGEDADADDVVAVGEACQFRVRDGHPNQRSYNVLGGSAFNGLASPPTSWAAARATCSGAARATCSAGFASNVLGGCAFNVLGACWSVLEHPCSISPKHFEA